MLDLGISKMALIGAVALIVIGPEKLPRVARTVGTLLGRAQRYVSEVKAEVNRAMNADDLKKMKETFEQAGREVEQSLNSARNDFQKNWAEAKDEIVSIAGPARDEAQSGAAQALPAPAPQYRRPDKNWRLKRGATPQWYKARQGVRRQVQSGAARVARFRPKRMGYGAARRKPVRRC
jgi:sec-independent protein translocase protein TatB